MGAKPGEVGSTCYNTSISEMSLSSEHRFNPVDNTVEDMVVNTVEEESSGTRMEVSQMNSQLFIAFDCIILRLEDALDENIRGLSSQKRRSIVELVQGAVETAKEKARLSQTSHAIFEEIGMTPEELRYVLPTASHSSSLMQTIAEEIGCEISEVLDIVKTRNLELGKLKSKLTEREESIKCLECYNCHLQEQVDNLAARIASTFGDGAASATNANGKKANGVDWSAVKTQLLSLNNAVQTNIQSRPACPRMKDGTAMHRRSISRGQSSPSYRSHSSASTVGGSCSNSLDLNREGSREAGHDSHAMNGMFSVFKEVFKAQSVAEVSKYDGKNSLSDFLRAMEVKYPSTVWSDCDRRNMLVNHLIGSARSVYKGLSNSVRKGSYAGIVQALREARRNPCERLKVIDEWDRLRKRRDESVGDFCCRMEDISRKIHPSNQWDFYLASKLYSCLQHWRDSYHMLAALEARDGEAYEAVKRVALRLEKTQAARFAGDDSNQGSHTIKRRITSERATTSLDDRTTQKCYSCGESGHFSSSCPRKSVPKGHSSGKKSQGGGRKYKDRRSPRKSLSTFVEEWCGMVRSQQLPGNSQTAAVGKPTLYDATIFGIKVRALIDTGSVISILPAALLKQAKSNGVDIDSEVEMVSNRCEYKVFDASGNKMEFLAVVNAEISIQGAENVRISMHVRKSKETTLLLGTNVLEALGVQLQFQRKAECLRNATGSLQHASVSKRVVIPPGATASIVLEGKKGYGEKVFWSNDPRIISGVCHLRQGKAEISVANRDSQTWVLRKGEPLGQWSDEAIIDPNSADMSISMLDMRKHVTLPKSKRLEVLVDILQHNHSSGELSKELILILEKFSETFAVNDHELEYTNLVEHEINVQGHPPIRQRTRPVPYGVRTHVADMLSDLKERKIIEESSSPWASPIVLVAKKDGNTRLCVDYREVNKITKKDCYPLPPIDVTLQNLQGKRWFSSLDLASGYWQVPLTENAKEISAFTTTSGLYQFNVLPFGLTNAPAAFQRLMDRVLGNLKGSEVSVYLDDILVATETEARHLEVLEQTLDAFRKANLKVKPQKCRLMEPTLEFLGHVVGRDGIRTNPDKVCNIQNYPVPQNIAQLRTFLGMAGYYRKFILRYAEIAKPLYDLTSPKNRFLWVDDHSKAFEKLKSALSSAPVLGQPNIEKALDKSRPFVIYTDASRIGVGAVLAQEGDDGFLHPIFFASKPLSSAERNYHVTDQEALALVYSLKKFHYFIFGIHTIVRTDHAALTSLFKRANVSPRVLRWALEIQRYDLSIEHVKGAANSVADALSRGPVDLQKESPSVWLSDEKVVCAIQEHAWLEELREDPNFEPVIKAVESEQEGEVRLPRCGRKLSSLDFVIDDGQLKLISEEGLFLPVVPDGRRHELFEEAHYGVLGGHFHARKMYNQLKKVAFWPGMYRDFVRWCKECQTCFLTNKKTRNVPPLKPISTGHPFEIVGIDLLEMGLTTRGNRYIVTIVDHFTKYLGAYPITDKRAETVAEALFGNWICGCGRWPAALLSDRGSEFENSTMEALCSIMGIQQKFTKGYCPRENGLTERANGTIVKMLRKKTVVPAEWDRILPTIVYAYNAAPNQATGESPHFLLYGHDPRYPSAVIPPDDLSPYMVDYDLYKTEFLSSLKIARDYITENANEYREKMRRSYDRTWNTLKSTKFKIGDRVYVEIPAEKGKSRHPKLIVSWEGPFRVISASHNSALVTLIGENKPPKEIPFDQLIKIPSQISDVPVKGLTTRCGKRGRSKKGASKNANVGCLVIQTYHFSTTLSSPTNVLHMDWRCPGKLMVQGMEVECSTDVTLQDLVPNVPFGALKFACPYELARLLSVLTQSHVPETWRTARLLDRTYDLVTPSGLGIAWSFYQQHCVHAALASVAQAGKTALEHPPRTGCDSTNVAVVAELARRYALSHPWTDSSWRQLTPRKNLIILPARFEKVVRCLKSESQEAIVMREPDEMQPEWFSEDYSCILLFSPAEFAGTTRWRGAWTLLMQMVAKGTDLIGLAGPINEQQWGKSVDMLRDLFEETLAQRPSLKYRLQCLLPLRSHQEAIDSGFSVIKYEDGKFFTQSAAKRFWNATMLQHSALLRLAPFRRFEENPTKHGGYHSRTTTTYRSQQQRPNTGRGFGRSLENRQAWRHPQEYKSYQRVDNRMFELGSVDMKRRNNHMNSRGRGGRGKPRY